MTTRNRTEEFLRLRASHRPDLSHHFVPDTADLLSGGNNDFSSSSAHPSSTAAGGGASSVEMTEPPEWLRFFQLIRHAQVQIINYQRALEEMQRKHLLVEFGKNRDHDKEERAIEELMRKILTVFEEADADLKALIESYEAEFLSGPDGGSQMQRKVLHNVQQCLAHELSTLNRQLRESHRRYVKALEKQSAVRSKSMGGTHQQEVEGRLQEQAKMEEYLQRGCTQEQVESIMLNSQRVNDLDREYTNILQNVRALHDMFSDLHTMVVEQGTILDRVEYNMTLTHDRVQSGQQHLVQAKKHQEASSHTICFMLLVVLIGGCLLALFVKMIIP